MSNPELKSYNPEYYQLDRFHMFAAGQLMNGDRTWDNSRYRTYIGYSLFLDTQKEITQQPAAIHAHPEQAVMAHLTAAAIVPLGQTKMQYEIAQSLAELFETLENTGRWPTDLMRSDTDCIFTSANQSSQTANRMMILGEEYGELSQQLPENVASHCDTAFPGTLAEEICGIYQKLSNHNKASRTVRQHLKAYKKTVDIT